MRPIDEPLKELKEILVEMSSITEKIIENLVTLKISLDLVKATVETIKEKRLEIQDKVLEILARYQPTASDLREVMFILDVSYGLYRLSRYALDVVTVVDRVTQHTSKKCEFTQCPKIFKQVVDMTFSSINAFLKRDKDLAKRVIEMDKVVDETFFEALDKISIQIDLCSTLELLILVYLERIADHCVYIAKEIIDLL